VQVNKTPLTRKFSVPKKPYDKLIYAGHLNDAKRDLYKTLQYKAQLEVSTLFPVLKKICDLQVRILERELGFPPTHTFCHEKATTKSEATSSIETQNEMNDMIDTNDGCDL
jgi:hypothetical protein